MKYKLIFITPLGEFTSTERDSVENNFKEEAELVINDIHRYQYIQFEMETGEICTFSKEYFLSSVILKLELI